MIQRTETKANKITTIRRGQLDRFIKGPSENNHSNHSKHNNNLEEPTQIQSNTKNQKKSRIEIELNNNKINNTNYDIQSFTNNNDKPMPELIKCKRDIDATSDNDEYSEDEAEEEEKEETGKEETTDGECPELTNRVEGYRIGGNNESDSESEEEKEDKD